MAHTPASTCLPLSERVCTGGSGSHHNQTTNHSSTSSSVNIDPVYEGIDAPKFVDFLVSHPMDPDTGVDNWFEQQAAKGGDGSVLSEGLVAAGLALSPSALDSSSLSTADEEKENRPDNVSQLCRQELPSSFSASGDQSHSHTTTKGSASACSSVEESGQGFVLPPPPTPPQLAPHDQMASKELLDIYRDPRQALPSNNRDEEELEEGEIVDEVQENGPKTGDDEDDQLLAALAANLRLQSIPSAPSTPAPVDVDVPAVDATVDRSQALLLAVPVDDQNVDMTGASESVSVSAADSAVSCDTQPEHAELSLVDQRVSVQEASVATDVVVIEQVSNSPQVLGKGSSSSQCLGVEQQQTVTTTPSEAVVFDTAVGPTDTNQPAAQPPTDPELVVAELPPRGQPEQQSAVGLLAARQATAQRPPAGRPPLPTAAAGSGSRPLNRTAAQATARLAQGSTVASLNRRAASPVSGAGGAGVRLGRTAGAAALPHNPQHKPAGFVPPLRANAHKTGPVRAPVSKPPNVTQAKTNKPDVARAATGSASGMSVSGRRADSRDRAKLAQLGAGLAGLRVPHNRPSTKAGGPQLLTMHRSNSRDVIVRQKQAATVTATNNMQSTAAASRAVATGGGGGGGGPLVGANAKPGPKHTEPEPFKFMTRPPKPQMVHAPKSAATTSSSAAASASATHGPGHSVRATQLSTTSVGSASGQAGATDKHNEKKGGDGGPE